MTLIVTFLIVSIGFILTVLFTPLFISLIKRMKFGQSIREEGPKSHMKKAGTPTMGGLVFILSIVLTTIGVSLYLDLFTTQTVVLILVLVGFGLIGFLDDFIKVVLKRNLGLTSLQKLVGQIILAVLSF